MGTTAFVIQSKDNGDVIRTKDISWDDIFDKKNSYAEVCHIFRDPKWVGTAQDESVIFESETPQTLSFVHTTNIYHEDVPRTEYTPLEPDAKVEMLVFNKQKRTLRRVKTNSFPHIQQ